MNEEYMALALAEAEAIKAKRPKNVKGRTDTCIWTFESFSTRMEDSKAGIPVFRNDELVFVAGGAPSFQPAAVAVAGVGIVINAGAVHIGEWFVNALISHEDAHFIYRHHEREGRGYDERYLEEEIQADAHSNTQGNDMVRALRIMREKVTQLGVTEGVEELDLRIQALTCGK